jgi:hypothetical protein
MEEGEKGETRGRKEDGPRDASFSNFGSMDGPKLFKIN